jgi:hypothetical protein
LALDVKVKIKRGDKWLNETWNGKIHLDNDALQ